MAKHWEKTCRNSFLKNRILFPMGLFHLVFVLSLAIFATSALAAPLSKQQDQVAKNPRFQTMVNMLAKQMVAKMDLTKVMNSNICPEVFSPEMCRQDSNGAFYVWVRELRQRALIKQLEEGMNYYLFKKLEI